MPDAGALTLELTTPDGLTHRFRYGGAVQTDGEDYVVLLALDATEGSAVLVTRMVQTEEGLSFAVEEDEETVGSVWMQYAAMQRQDGE